MYRRVSADSIRTQELEFWYVYILLLNNRTYYTGCTQNINDRLFRHEHGMVPYTMPYRPVKLVYYSAFRGKYMAYNFGFADFLFQSS